MNKNKTFIYIILFYVIQYNNNKNQINIIKYNNIQYFIKS